MRTLQTLRRDIKDILLTIGVRINHLAFNYFVEAVMLKVAAPDFSIPTMRIYDKLAEMFSTTASSIERSMRYELIYVNIDKLKAMSNESLDNGLNVTKLINSVFICCKIK